MKALMMCVDEAKYVESIYMNCIRSVGFITILSFITLLYKGIATKLTDVSFGRAKEGEGSQAVVSPQHALSERGGYT